MNSKSYKTKADELLAINDRKSDFVKITLIVLVVSVGFSLAANTTTSLISIPLSLLASFIITPMASFLLQRTAYKVYCNKDIDINDLFTDYSKFSDVVLYNLVSAVIVLFATLLFIIPGIMISYSYMLGNFIMVDEPDIPFEDALKKSKEMMKGHRFELFKLDLSFAGWIILEILTLGILTLWVQPRLETAHMVFYARLKKELYGEEVNGITESNAPVDNNSIPAGYENYYNSVIDPAACEPV